jgi:hypothetical protein
MVTGRHPRCPRRPDRFRRPASIQLAVWWIARPSCRSPDYGQEHPDRPGEDAGPAEETDGRDEVLVELS